MYRIALLIFMLVSFLPLAATHAQDNDPLVTVSIAETEVEPGGTITVTWEASRHLRRFHHVAIELWHPVLMQPVKLTSPSRTGTIEMTVPDTYYDTAVVEVYPEKATNQRYKDPANQTIFAEAEVVVNDGVEVASFTISPNPVERGEPVTVTWEVVNANGPAPNVVLIYPGEEDFYENEYGLPAAGSFTISIPEYYTEAFSVSLIADMTMGAHVETTLICPFEDTLIEQLCPIEQNTVTLTYQYFENGLFVQWGDLVFVLNNNHSASFREATPADVTDITPPDGLFLPAPEYAGTWLEYQAMYGFALDASASYTALLEVHPGTSGRHKAEVYWFRLPDDTLISVNLMSLGWSVLEE